MLAKRKTLIKMKNGRHRVASSWEADCHKTIEKAAHDLVKMDGQLRSARMAIARAREDGATEVLRAKHLPEQLNLMRRELVETFGEKAAKPLAQLLASDRRQVRSPYELRAVISDVERVTYIEGIIPDLHYRVMLA